jgi:hypothetical protein
MTRCHCCHSTAATFAASTIAPSQLADSAGGSVGGARMTIDRSGESGAADLDEDLRELTATSDPADQHLGAIRCAFAGDVG